MNTLLTLHFYKGMKRRDKRELLEKFGTTYFESKNWISHLEKDSSRQAQWHQAQQWAERELRMAVDEKYCIWSIDDPMYPDLLHHIPDPPIAVMGRGYWPNEKIPLAVVGTRKPSSYGRNVVIQLTTALSEYPINLVSGLALGIDAQVHRTALDSGATTVAFVAGGMGHFSPKSNKKLADEMVEAGGGYFTEQPFDQPCENYTYPVRNRLIAGSTLATVVVEAARKSGALITANQAHAYEREVYAVPGATFMPMSEGPNVLIEEQLAQALVNINRFPSRFYPLWQKNDDTLDLSDGLEAVVLSQFPHGRKVKSGTLKSRLNVSNSNIFKALRVLLELGLLEKIGPDLYCRKSV
jgi:DNA processing protein